MFVLLSSPSDILDLTVEQLQYIPKPVLLRVCGHYVHHLWDRLPEHLKADSEIQQYRRCLKHYNLPRHQTHFDGPAFPFELHIPGYQFCGPGTHLEKRLARGDRGINPLDAACREHDIAYSHSNDLAERHVADKILAEKARKRIIARNSTLGERAAAAAVWAAMKAKTKIGMGMKTKMKTKVKTKKKTKRVLPTAKRGGILPILPMLGALGSLIGGAAGVAKAVSDSKTTRRQLEELQRHNRAMEGHGLYLAPYKYGKGLYLGPYKRGQGVITKKKKKRRKNIKNACGCDNEHTIGSSGKTHACTIF